MEHQDIRDRAFLSGNELASLNFIKNPGPFVFRKFYRTGLRSHIFEVLHKEDVEKESTGEIIDGIRMFPRARPGKMFRILRTRFETKARALEEIKKYSLLLSCLGPGLIAASNEVIVDYTGTGQRQILLCGLQDYVEGEILDPWRLKGDDYLHGLFRTMPDKLPDQTDRIEKARAEIELFVKKIRSMISRTGYIPDLAGFGNLILTPGGKIRLVDINNIVEIRLDGPVPLDDKGYPSCDVSVHVLSILETKFLKTQVPPDDPIYRVFLSRERRQAVKNLEKRFYMNM